MAVTGGGRSAAPPLASPSGDPGAAAVPGEAVPGEAVPGRLCPGGRPAPPEGLQLSWWLLQAEISCRRCPRREGAPLSGAGTHAELAVSSLWFNLGREKLGDAKGTAGPGWPGLLTPFLNAPERRPGHTLDRCSLRGPRLPQRCLRRGPWRPSRRPPLLAAPAALAVPAPAPRPGGPAARWAEWGGVPALLPGDGARHYPSRFQPCDASCASGSANGSAASPLLPHGSRQCGGPQPHFRPAAAALPWQRGPSRGGGAAMEEQGRRQRARQLEQEERLAAELARLNRERLKDERMRQQVRENSIELRELEKRLKSAYMNKERAAQIAEKEAIQYEKMKREAEIAQKMREEYERVTKEESCAELRRNKEKIMYQQELEKQLEEQERKKQDAYEEFLKEKLMIDEIVRKIYEEDQMEKQLKLEKMRATQAYIEEFKKEQALWRRRKREEMEEENRKIVEFANMQRQREEDRMAKVRENEEKKQRLQSMMAQNLEREQQKREELEQVRQELHQEEQAEMERKKEMAEIEKRIRQRIDLRQTYEEQFALKKIVQQAMQEEEEAFRQEMLAKFAEDDRIEQMNAQKRRMKQLEHRRAVEKLIEDRHKQFLADKEREFEERQLEERRQENIRLIVEEERQKLLKEHASKLLGYLPRGILKDEDDVNMLGEEFRLAYQKRSGNTSSAER
ncbi:meiosis-specific nuclear structural protein 1 [Eudromia elegans]